MGLGYCGVKLLSELWRRDIFNNVESVIDMGSQELHMTMTDFERLISAYRIPNYKPNNFPNLKYWPSQPRCSTKPFYEMLGFRKYSCIDLSKQYGAIPHDLNLSFEDRTLYGTYDLVTDYGCCEHVFNVFEAYRTMHRLCKSHGIMVIIQVGYKGNGYHNFNPSYFESIAAVNSYEILYSSYILSVIPEHIRVQHHIPLSSSLLDLVDMAKISDLGICYVFQKTSDDDFKIPYQRLHPSNDQKILGLEIQYHFDPPEDVDVTLLTDDLRNINGKVILRVLLNRLLSKIGIKSKA